MAHLAHDVKTDKLRDGTFRVPVAAGACLYAGAMVAINASGYAVRASADNTLRVAGVCQRTADNTSGGAAALFAEISSGVFYLQNDGTNPVTVTDGGKLCYVRFDGTVSISSDTGARPIAGTVVDLRGDGQIGVDIGGASSVDLPGGAVVLTDLATPFGAGATQVLTTGATGAVQGVTGVTAFPYVATALAAANANIAVNAKKITGVADPTNAQDAATMLWVQSNAAAPGTAVVSDTVAATVGAASTYLRSDAKLIASTAAPSSVGAANAQGTSGSLARADHVHQMVFQTKSQQILVAALVALGAVKTGTINISTAVPANARLAWCNTTIATKFQNAGDADVTTVKVGVSGGALDLCEVGLDVGVAGTYFGLKPAGTATGALGASIASGQMVATFGSDVNFDTLTAGSLTIEIGYWVQS